MSVQEYILSRIGSLIGVIQHILDDEDFSDRFHELRVCPSPFLEAEVTYGIGSNEILQSLSKEWKRRLKVHA